VSRLLLAVFFLVLIGCGKSVDITEYRYLGDQPFEREAWGDGLPGDRSKMVYSFLHENEPITKLTKRQIISELGKPTTYYVQEYFPAYLIEHEGKKYVLAFSLEGNESTSQVKNVYVEEYQRN